MTEASAGLCAREVLRAYGLEGASLTRIDTGLINRSFVVARAFERWVLQWVNPIFGPAVHDDIDVVTAHLEAAGILTPRLVRNLGGELFTRGADGGVWRLLTWIDGISYHRIPNALLCESAGRLVGRFHVAVRSLRYTFRHRRPHVHDGPYYFARLAEVLATHAGHERHATVLPVAREILARGADLPPAGRLPARIVHGDPKISNVMFSKDGDAVALVDLDALAERDIPSELGDAWRSWCNPRGEDDLETRVDLGFVEAALRGYATTCRGMLTAAEVAALPVAIEAIALELAARFCTDALEQTYFAWDSRRFASSSEHNFLRARGQLALARSCGASRHRIRELVDEALG